MDLFLPSASLKAQVETSCLKLFNRRPIISCYSMDVGDPLYQPLDSGNREIRVLRIQPSGNDEFVVPSRLFPSIRKLFLKHSLMNGVILMSEPLNNYILYNLARRIRNILARELLRVVRVGLAFS